MTAYASLAENLPSDTAYRPSDVLTMYGGKTVENGNTDAEGRLVMADAIVRASEDAPDLIVDVATLTGAAIVALGDRTAGLMASDDDTADQVLDAAEAAGEDVWQLPIPPSTSAGSWIRRWPTCAPPPATGPAGPWSRPRSCASSSARASPGLTWTSPVRPAGRVRPTGTSRAGAPA